MNAGGAFKGEGMKVLLAAKLFMTENSDSYLIPGEKIEALKKVETVSRQIIHRNSPVVQACRHHNSHLDNGNEEKTVPLY